MEVLDTNIAGLKLIIDDTRATYTKEGGGEALFDGEWQFGEAWIGDAWYTYERVLDGEVVLNDAEGVECYRFEDSEEGWEQFADSVL